MNSRKLLRATQVIGFLGYCCCLVVFGVSCNKSESRSPEHAKQQRLQWNLKTTVEAYSHAGFANPAWDESARKCLDGFARSRAAIDTNEPLGEIIATNAALAIDAGCNDPLVNYLYIKFSMAQTNNKEAFVAAFCKTAREMRSSSYPSVRKFYAAARAVDQIFYTYGTNSPSHPEEHEMFLILNEALPETLADQTMPGEEAYEVAQLILQLTGGSEDLHARTYQMVETALMKNWPDSYTTWYLKGNQYIYFAWKARGGGYASTVTAEGWIGFSNDLAVAQDAFEHAWKIDPKQSDIADQMITVVLGQGGDRARMELWFKRAMEVNTNDYAACHQKLYFLEPKWYGSDEEQLAFGRECVQSTNWGGRVPLTLLDAHEYIDGRNEGEARTNYWKRPEVWSDLQAAFERFFELNPDDVRWYHSYALYAYRAEQWEKLNELLPKLGPINYDFFGGKDQFDKMVQLAKEHSGKN